MYSPASNITGTATLRHQAAVYYNRTGLDQLTQMFYFQAAGESEILPLRNGKLIQWFRYDLLNANLTPASEGIVGVGLQLSSNTVTASVVEYGDYASFSTLLRDTAVDDIAANASKALGYRAALTADTVARTELDSLSATTNMATAGPNGTSADLRRAKALLAGQNVLPKENGDYFGIMHPYVRYDILSDNAAGGFIDVMRYSQPEVAMTGEIGKVEGVRLVQTTNVATDGVAAPLTKYTTYVVGKGAMGVVALGGNGPSKVTDIQKQSFAVNVVQGGKSSIYDPTGTIGFIVGYRFVFVAKLLDTTTPRFKTIPMDSSII
jgi:N4-gp56 family major capsid protein